MKKLVGLLIVLSICISFVYSVPTDEQIRQAANTLGVPFADLKTFVQSYQPQSVPAGAITISAAELKEAYNANSVKADLQYKNKIVKVTGRVTRISNDYIELDDSVFVFFKSSEVNKAADLTVGQTVTLVGTCTEGWSSSVHVKDAVFSR
jgi:hypothetical protein